MAIRLRRVNGVLIALCAAKSKKKVDDVYLDDEAHYALNFKFRRDHAEEDSLPMPHPDAVEHHLITSEETEPTIQEPFLEPIDAKEDSQLWLSAYRIALEDYSIIIETDTLSNGQVIYMARTPELQGCKSQGASVEWAVKNLIDARVDYIYYLLRDGLPIPSARAK
jgi:predicted RNase H-like HicB family nuclease